MTSGAPKLQPGIPRRGRRCARGRRSGRSRGLCAGLSDVRTGEDGSSSSGWAAQPATRPMPSTTSGRSVASRPTHRPTTSRSSRPGPTTRDGTPPSRNGCAAQGSAPPTASWSFRWAEVIPSGRVGQHRPGARAGPEAGASIFGIVGRDGGYTAQVADACVVLPPLFADHVTPLTEGLCAVMWHLLVSHPSLTRHSTKWESMR